GWVAKSSLILHGEIDLRAYPQTGILVSCILGVPSNPSAETRALSLTLELALEMAQRDNPNLEAMRERIVQAEAEHSVSFAEFCPSRALVRRVTLGCFRAGRTAITSASDLAWTTQGKPSQSMQRTHALNGMFFSLSRMPQGA